MQMKNLRARELRNRDKEDDDDRQKEMREKVKDAKRRRLAFDKVRVISDLFSLGQQISYTSCNRL